MDHEPRHHTSAGPKEQVGLGPSDSSSIGPVRSRRMLITELKDALAESKPHQGLAGRAEMLVLAHCEAAGLSKQTAKKYSWAFERCLAWCAEHRVQPDDLSTGILEKYFENSDLRHETKRAHAYGISLSMRLLQEHGVVVDNPAAEFRLAPELNKQRAVSCLGPAEVAGVIERMPDNDRGVRDAALFELAWATACTAESAARMSFGDMRPTDSGLEVRAWLSSDSSYLCLIPHEDCKHLNEYIKRLDKRDSRPGISWESRDANEAIFRSLQRANGAVGPRGLSAADLASAVQRRLKESGFERHTIRSIRRGRIRQWIEMATSSDELEIVRVVAGVGSIQALFRYVNWQGVTPDLNHSMVVMPWNEPLRCRGRNGR